MTASRCLAATSGDCTLRLVFPKGDDSGVSTLPGVECHANRFRLPPPELNGSGSHELIERGLGGPLAVTSRPGDCRRCLPTLADNVANTAFPWRGSKGSTCFMIRAGPIALSAKERVICEGS